MIQTAQMFFHKAFGLNVLSEVNLPEVPQMSIQDGRVDIFIERGDLSYLWLELSPAKLPQQRFVVKDSRIMFHIPDTAIFCIEDGVRIIVSPMKGSDEDKVRLYILGTCMGALLMQRKVLPLHGSAVAIDGKVYAFVGDRGAGKSTLASALLSEGYPLLSDDLIAVSLSEDNHIPLVMPSYPQQKLWKESLKEFGMVTSDYRPIFQRENKYAIPVQSKFCSEPLPLAGVFELVKTTNDAIEIDRLQGLKRVHTLFYNTYRSFLLSRMQLMEWHFSTTTNIVNHIDIFQVRRPSSSFTAPKLASLIINLVKEVD
jgi:hypothetical protein